MFRSLLEVTTKKRCLTKIDLSDENNNLRKQNPFKICWRVAGENCFKK